MTTLGQEHERGPAALTTPAVLDYRSVSSDRLDGREHAVGALRNVALMIGMLACVTAFLFLALGALGLMVAGATGWGSLGAGVFCMMLALGALLLAGLCLDSMR
jgi:hypothetical protein